MVDASAITKPDLGTIDAFARWQLELLRVGATLRTRDATDDLRDLLELVGLADVVALPVEVGGQTEEGEQLGVEEVVQPRDPPA